MTRPVALAATLALCVVGTTEGGAWAGTSSLVTAGAGLDVGMARDLLGNAGSEQSAVAQVNARVRLLRLVGLSFAYDPAAADGPLSADFTLTAQIFIVPTRWVGVYLLGGLGARDIRDPGNISVTVGIRCYI
jgi:hypothetical protein